MLDIGLLRKAVEWAEHEAAKPESQSEWRQYTWVSRTYDCGTACCMAGKIVLDHDGLDELLRLDSIVTGGEAIAVGVRAAALLGVEFHEVMDSSDGSTKTHLFHGSNDLADVQRLAAELAAKYGEVL